MTADQVQEWTAAGAREHHSGQWNQPALKHERENW
jgi:hypothetical protein